MSYLIGTQVALRLKVSAVAGGAPVDPDTVVLMLKPPTGATRVLNYPADIVREAAGHFRALFVGDAAGVWLYRWEGGGTATGAVEGSVQIDASRLG